MGFFRGLLAPFRGAAFLSRERLWHLVLLPALANLVLATGAALAFANYWREELAHKTVGTPALDWLLFGAATAVGALVLFIVFQPVAGAIFNDHLSERVERKLRGDVPRAPFFASVGRSLVHALLKLVLYGLAVVAGLGLTAVTGIGGAIGVALGVLFLAYDGFDFPLARRGVGFGGKWRYLALHPALTIGYGVGAMLLYLVPLAFLIAPPLAAVGATLAFIDAENRRSRKKGNGDEAGTLRNGQG